MNTSKHQRNLGVGALFFTILCVGFLVQIVSPDIAYSKNENRILEEMPEFSVSKYMDGTFQDDFETYISDQYPNRDIWMKAKTQSDIIFGKRLIQDVYIAEDGYLIQKYVPLKEDPINEKKAKIINEFSLKYPDINYSFMLIPNKVAIYEDLLPLNAVREKQTTAYQSFYEMLDQNINKLDTLGMLKQHKDEDLFYKTDHHWTTKAAKYAADQFLAKDEIAYDIRVSNDQFVGTLANKISFYENKDTVELYIPVENKVEYIVDFMDDSEKRTSVYDLEKQFDADAYQIFLGGNHPITKISTTSNENKRLLMFKDSYANCFVPFLIPYYSEIIMIDSRYYYDDINVIIKDEDITDVLFLYNMNTFSSDTTLNDLLMN